MSTTTAPGLNILDLLRQLKDDTTLLVREEVALAKAETVEKLPAIIKNVGFLAAGALVGYSALVIVLMAVGWALSQLFLSMGLGEGTSVFLGLLIVGLLVAGISAALVMKGIKALKQTTLAPQKTVQTLKEDKEWVQTRINT